MFKKIGYALDYFKYLKNPVSCLLFKFGFKKDIIVKIKNSNYSLKINNVGVLNVVMTAIENYWDNKDFMDFINSLYDGEDVVNIEGIKIFNPISHPLNQIFYEYFADYYNNFEIDYNNKVIIDVGANAADSALFFASKGAKVYGFEPVKEVYEMALKNVNLNPNLSKNIKLFNLVFLIRMVKLI